MDKIQLLTILAVLSLSNFNSVASDKTFRTSLEDEFVEFSCPSKEPPIWERFSKIDNVKLAVGVTKRTSFDDKRYVVASSQTMNAHLCIII